MQLVLSRGFLKHFLREGGSMGQLEKGGESAVGSPTDW